MFTAQKAVRWLGIGGMLFALYLIFRELTVGECPEIGPIPACYPVLLAFFLVTISTFVEKAKPLLFYSGFVIGFGLAVWFSFHQCPFSLSAS